MSIDDWNVRIIQDGDLVKDVLYNIYDDLSICFDENEGHFFHKDYETALKNNDIEHRTPLLPQRNYHIKEHDYFSVSVSLEAYIKMLKGEKPFPNNLNLESRKKHSILFESLAKIDEETKKFIESIYCLLSTEL